MLDDVNWPFEVIGAISGSGNDAIQKAKPNFRNDIIASSLVKAMKNKNANTDKIVKVADLKIKTFSKLEKVFGFTNSELFKLGGHGVGILDYAIIARGLMDTWSPSSDLTFGQRIDKTAKYLAGTISSTLLSEEGMVIGAKIGAAIGSIFPGAGTIVGAFIGGAIGAIAGSIIGCKIGETIYDGYIYCANLAIKKLAGVVKSFSSGGVEFILPKEIYEFKKIFCFNNIHKIN